MARLLEKYRKEIAPEYVSKFGLKNIFQVPRLKKIVINIGINEPKQDAKILESIVNGVSKITGQKPSVRKARLAVAGFKLKQGSPCGCVVTLRKTKMYEFLDRLVNIALPRERDFHGLPVNAFDENGNYTFGLNDQTIFPEISVDNAKIVHGMHITLVMNSGSADKSRELLKMFGFPFKK